MNLISQDKERGDDDSLVEVGNGQAGRRWQSSAGTGGVPTAPFSGEERYWEVQPWTEPVQESEVPFEWGAEWFVT